MKHIRTTSFFKRHKWVTVGIVSIVSVLIFVGIGFAVLRMIDPSYFFSSSLVQHQVTKRIGPVDKDIFELLPVALGFRTPQTYLILFLNNTEIRPGGGFIGVYAVVRVDRGKMEVVTLEGSEILDYQTPDTWKPAPPQILAENLGVSQWYFRDSNWSPDFVTNATRAIEFYAEQGGLVGRNIDGVLAISTAVLEEIMTRTGSVTVDGITFRPENVIETLEYDVEYGYRERGLSMSERKKIIQPLMLAVVDRLRDDVLQNPIVYREMLEKLLRERHAMFYSTDPEIQKILDAHEWTGRVHTVVGDYLMWVDANLGALKTDYAIHRELSYVIEPAIDESGISYYRARVSMHYRHTRPFDWRTSRYRTYARVYVPEGSELISVEGSMRTDRSNDPGVVDSGVEYSKQWFGTFISIEPLTTRTLTYTYRLPESIGSMIDAGTYTLFTQKQSGVVNATLTLDLDFGTHILQSAVPPELPEQWGDAVYSMRMPFITDQSFRVELTR